MMIVVPRPPDGFVGIITSDQILHFSLSANLIFVRCYRFFRTLPLSVGVQRVFNLLLEFNFRAFSACRVCLCWPIFLPSPLTVLCDSTLSNQVAVTPEFNLSRLNLLGATTHWGSGEFLSYTNFFVTVLCTSVSLQEILLDLKSKPSVPHHRSCFLPNLQETL